MLRKRKYILFVLYCITAWVVFLPNARGANITLSAPERVAVGERFRVVYAIDARPSDFQAPTFGDLRIVSGPSQSTSSSTQIINNQVTTTLSVSYTYVVEALKEGSFTIGPATFVVDGRTVRSDSHTVVVSGQAPAGRPSQHSQPSQPQAQQGPTSQDIFIRAQVSNQNPFQSEQVIVSYRLYTRIAVARYSIDRLPSYQGFWTENLTSSSQPQPTVEVIDGQQYNVVEIRRVALFPQRAGELRIDPLEVETVVRMRSQRRSGSIFDDFFGGVQDIPHKVRSNAVVLQVRPLPSQNRPATFHGMVGNFEIEANLSANEIQVNDAANLVLTISGSGNLRMTENPDIQFPPNLEVFAPNISDQIRQERTGIAGSRSFDYTIIPRTPGEFEILAIPFSFFNPSTGQYITRLAGPFTISVHGMTGDANDASGTIYRSDVQSLSTDIRFIVARPVTLFPIGRMFYRSNLFYMSLALPFVLFAVVLIIGRRQIKQRSNIALMRTRKAEKLAKRRLRTASACLKKEGQEQLFYDEIFRALWGYLSDKLNIPVSRLNKDEVMKVFESRTVSKELANQFLDTVQACEFARFAPGRSDMKMEQVYQQAINAIIRMEKEFKIKRN